MDRCDIGNRHCQPCEGGMPALDPARRQTLLAKLPGWTEQAKKLEKNFSFRDHHETLAFVNALAWISHRENHHPELTVGYRDCRVRYWTHAIGDLSENDFICAAKIERLLEI